MNHKLIHIFDNSACLTRKQLRDYISCKMIDEEAHATEVHLISCKLCSEAVEGYTKNNSVLEAMMELDSDFLEPHFPLHALHHFQHLCYQPFQLLLKVVAFGARHLSLYSQFYRLGWTDFYRSHLM